MSLYGEHYLVYGSQKCGLCNQTHDKFKLEESSKSRFKLLQFAAELATINKDQSKKADMQRAAVLETILEEKKRNHPNVPTITIEDPRGAKSTYVDPSVRLEVFQRMLAKRDQAEAKGKSDVWRGTTSVAHRINNKFDGKGKSLGTKDWKAMLGLLITPLGTYVGAAGTFSRQPGVPFDVVANRKGYILADKQPKGDTPSIGGVQVPRDKYEGAKVQGTMSAGSCAAPQLIQQYIFDAKQQNFSLDKSRSLSEQGFALSEMYFVPNHSVRFDLMYPNYDPTIPKPNPKTDWEHRDTDPGLYWIPGLSAHSCKTCENLVPMLLCPGAIIDHR